MTTSRSESIRTRYTPSRLQWYWTLWDSNSSALQRVVESAWLPGMSIGLGLLGRMLLPRTFEGDTAGPHPDWMFMTVALVATALVFPMGRELASDHPHRDRAI